MGYEEQLPRKLTAILYADVAGYSRLTGEDEEGTHRRLSEYLDLISGTIETHRGRVVHYAGDAILADFATVTEALSCAWDSQQALAQRNDELATERRVEFRIGVNLGEVIVDRDDIYGDGVNVAARLESLAEPGGICVSESVRTAAGSKLALGFEFMGERDVKNIAEPVRVYRVVALEDIADARTVACPYPGMVPFSAADAAHFYGREEEVTRMVQLLRRQRFMMVIGPSGSGKSSLVYAGLLPELERSRYFAKDYWLIRTMRPGPNPTGVLASVFGGDGNEGAFEPDSVDALLGVHPPAERLLLLVDQFEEVFAQAERAEQARFIAALQALRAPENCALILTLRADFYPDLMNSYLWPVDASQRVEVAPLRGQALREAIERPAADVGVRIEDKLVTQLLADAADEPGALPLLQETMGLLWDDIEQRTLRYSAYERLSRGAGEANGALTGLAVAIAMKADATLAELDQAKQAIARRIFLRLIQFGEGRADTRRQQPVAALQSANDAAGEFEQTLEHLTAHRLLTRSGGHDNTPPAVDISHESLIDGWSRLQDWADERREAEQIRRRLESKASEWVRLGKGTGGLLDEVALPEAERWLTSADAADLGFDAALPELVAASQQAIDAANKAREDAREQELRQAEALAEEQRQRIAEQNRATKRMRYSMMGLAAVFVVAVGAAIFAWMQSEKAQQLAEQEVSAREDAEARRFESERARAQAERLRAASIAQLLLTLAPQQQAIDQDERSALMARQAYLLSGNDSGRLRDHADRVLRTVLTAPGFAATLTTEVLAVDFSPDGRMLAASSYAGEKVGQMLLWDLSRRGAPPITLPGPTDENFYTVSFRPDGKVLAAARDEDGTVLLWDLEQPSDPPAVVAGYEGGAWSLAFSPDGRHLAIGARYDDTVRLLDLSDPDAGLILGAAEAGLPDIAMRLAVNPGGVAVAFSPDGRTLAAGSHLGSVRIWDPSAPTKPVFEYRGHEGPVWSLAFNPDGNRLASGGKDATVRVWDMRDADAPPRLLRGHEEGITSLAFGRDGETLASGSTDDSIRLWDLANPDDGPVLVRSGPLDVHDLAISPDGLRLASGASGLHGLQLLDLRPSGQPGVLPQDGSLVSVAISPDGAFLASTSDDVIRLRNQSDPSAPPTDLRGHSKKLWGLAFSPDGKMLSSTSQDGTVRLWRLGSPIEEIAALKGAEPWSAPFSPDGKTLATSYYDETIEEMILRLWDLNDLDAEPMVLRTEMTRWINEIAFSSDGRRLVATGREGLIHLEDLESPGAGAEVLRGHEGMTWSVAFSPDSTQLASGGRDSTVRLWDLADEGTRSSILGQHDDEVVRVRFSPDGKYLATSSKDRSVRLWNLVTPNTPPALLHGHEGAVWALAWSPDSKTLVSGSKQLLFWDLTHPVTAAPLGRLAELVCEKVWRNLTLEEWHQFVGTDIPYERTCPNLPIHPSLLETAEKNAKAGDTEGAVALFQRAIELQPDLRIRPEAEAARLASEAQ